LVVEREIRSCRGQPIQATCRCDCGQEHTVSRGNLERTQSCGCLRRIDYTGQRFCNLVVLEMTEVVLSNGKVERHCLCRCDCGTQKRVAPGALLNGGTKACGCRRTAFIEVGKRFGRLVIRKKTRVSGKHGWFYQCDCDCGGENLVRGSVLKRGMTQSCGCLQGGVLPDRKAAQNMVMHGYRKNARKRGLTFDLTFEEAEPYFQGDCHYCGCPPSNQACATERSGSYTYNGIDRLDNRQGYIKGNMVACCRDCNWAKHTLEVENFLDHVEEIRVMPRKEFPVLVRLGGVLRTYKGSATDRSLSFSLTDSETCYLLSQPCYYCGQNPYRHSNGVYSGIDRVDNDEGYEPNNCVSCCSRCNRMKAKRPAQEFLDWAQRVRDYQH
jgi:hypothetical protein